MTASISQVFLIVAAVLFGCAGVGLPYNLMPWGLFFWVLAVLLGGVKM
jgi:hypothetical protein